MSIQVQFSRAFVVMFAVVGGAGAALADATVDLIPTLPGGGVAPTPAALSADGRVVVGVSRSTEGWEAFRWTRESGPVGLGDLPGGEFDSRATAASADGSVIVGTSATDKGNAAFRWTEEGGMESLGELPGGLYGASATAVSADGSVVAGNSFSSRTRVGLFSPDSTEMFRWTRETGMVGLGFLHDEDRRGGASNVYDMTPDGRVIVGSSDARPGEPYRWFEAVRWTEESGFEPVSDETSSSAAYSVSDDGDALAGEFHCIDVDGTPMAGFSWTESGGRGDPRCGEAEPLVSVSGNGRVVLGRSGSVFLDGEGPIAFETIAEIGGIDLEEWRFFGITAMSRNGLAVLGMGMKDGTLAAWIVRFSDCNGNGVADSIERAFDHSVECGVAETFRRGDANGDGSASVADALAILLYLFDGQDAVCAKAYDVDDLGTVNIADAIYLLNHLFASGADVPEPYENCGADPTDDRLTCEDGCAA